MTGDGPPDSTAVRTFVWDDLPSVVDLWRRAGPGIHLGPSDSPGELRRKWQHDPTLFVVAESEVGIVGAVMAGYDGRRGIVYHLAVDPARRHTGLGRRLMDEIEARLAGLGCRKSYLLVTPDNPAAVGFYRRHGWQVMDMVLMGKDLL